MFEYTNKNIILYLFQICNDRFLYIVGPLAVKDSESGAFTIIGVTCDAPYKWDQYRSGPYATYSRVSAVLPWIYETMQAN